MVFRRVGRLATRYRLQIIVIWIASAAIITLLAPNIDSVASSDQADFLPDDAPFVHANDVYREAFPQRFAPSSTLIVIDAAHGGGIADLTADTFEAQMDTPAGRFIRDLVEWLSGDSGPEPVMRVTAPTLSPAAAALMIGPENDVAIVQVAFSTSSPEDETGAALHAIDTWLTEHLPEGIVTYQTGEAPIVSNTTESIKTSVDRTIWVTIVLVILMLLLVYRSPVSPLIPLTAVTIAYLITRGLVAFMGAHLMTITSYANVLLVVVMYGAGTDYCLFLISRFREEMADQIGLEKATTRTVHLVGETITSSAGTIFVGFMAMSFAEMGIFNTSGPALALGIVMSLLAGLTLTPALLATLGNRAFWPGKATHRSPGTFYELTSKQVSSRPLATILIIVAAMAPFSIYGLQQRPSYNLLHDLPKTQPSVQGYNRLQETLGAGTVLPLSVVVTGRDPDTIAADIAHLTDELAALKGVADVRGLNSPLGQGRDLEGLLRVDAQIRLAQSMLTSANPSANLDLAQLRVILTGVQDYLNLIAERFPQVADDPNLATLRDLLANPLQLASQREAFGAALEGLADRFLPTEKDPITDPYLMPTALNTIMAALPAGSGADLFSQLLPTYLSSDGTAFKLDVVFAVPPTSYEAMDTLHDIRRILKTYEGEGEAVASGGTAITTDLRDTMDRDLLRAIGFVLAGIFVVLLLMLRSVVAPVYLIGTVLLSFTCTLGLTNLVFKTWWGVEGLTWYGPVFMFVFLVALGMDYSIFLFGRIKEEVAYHGPREGIHIAVARTGAIITSAGVILAGTFAAVITGEIKGLAEVGFAVAVGVLIDTFVVRTILDPALATLFGKWTWWPGGVPKAHPTDRQVPAGSEPQPGH